MVRSRVAHFVLFICIAIVLAVTPWFHTPFGSASRQAWVCLLGLNGIAFLALTALGGFKRLPRPAIIFWGVLLFIGWGMVGNAGGTYSLNAGNQPHVEPIAGAISWMPGALDVETSFQTMLQVTGLAALFGSACIVGQSMRSRRRVLALMIGLSICIGVEGFLERAGILRLYSSQHLRNEGLAFASFNYHANAGAFLNLGLGLASGGAATRRNSVKIILFLSAAAICLAGVAATGSRGSAVISVGIVATAIAVKLSAYRRRRPFAQAAKPFATPRRSIRPRRSRWPVGAAIISILILAALAGVVYAFAGPALARWSTLPFSLKKANPRMVLWRLMLPEALDAGPFGIGPGQLKILFSGMHDQLKPLYRIWIVQSYNPARATSMWLQMHNDPLQTLIEWGWIGAMLWGFLFAGALWPSARPDRTRFAIRLAIVGCLVHACFDFPLQVPAIQTYVITLLGLAWSRRAPRCRQTSVAHKLH